MGWTIPAFHFGRSGLVRIFAGPDIGEAMTSAGLGPYGVLLLIIIACLVLGMFMDSIAMLVVTVRSS